MRCAPFALTLLLAGAPLPGQVRITKTSDLRFGTLVPGAGAGRLVLDPDGKVLAEGLFPDTREVQGPAVFLLEGPPDQPFTVDLEPRVIIPWHQGGLELERFQPALRAGGQRLVFNGHGQAELRVGATLRVPGAGSGPLPGHQLELKVSCAGSTARAPFELQGRIMLPLQVRAVGTLAFGRFLAPGEATLVRLDPASGERTVDQGRSALLLGKAGTPGRFQVDGEPWEKVFVQLPSPTQKGFLKGPGEPIELFDFRTDPAPGGLVLDGAGKGQLKVGASLRLHKDQKAGTYEGYYTVVFNYP